MCLVKCLNEVLVFNLKNSCVCWFWDTSLFMISELSIVETSLFDFIVCSQRWSLQGIIKMKIFQSKACNYCKYISYNNIPSLPLPICCCLWITKFHTNWENNVSFVIEAVCSILARALIYSFFSSPHMPLKHTIIRFCIVVVVTINIFLSSSILWKVPNEYSWCGLHCGHDLIYERKETIKTLISRLKLWSRIQGI